MKCYNYDCSRVQNQRGGLECKDASSCTGFHMCFITNFDHITASPEELASFLLPLMPSMEGFCKYCNHWTDGECAVNPNWDCKNALVNWLNALHGFMKGYDINEV